MVPLWGRESEECTPDASLVKLVALTGLAREESTMAGVPFLRPTVPLVAASGPAAADRHLLLHVTATHFITYEEVSHFDQSAPPSEKPPIWAVGGCWLIGVT